MAAWAAGAGACADEQRLSVSTYFYSSNKQSLCLCAFLWACFALPLPFSPEVSLPLPLNFRFPLHLSMAPTSMGHGSGTAWCRVVFNCLLDKWSSTRGPGRTKIELHLRSQRRCQRFHKNADRNAVSKDFFREQNIWQSLSQIWSLPVNSPPRPSAGSFRKQSLRHASNPHRSAVLE